MNVALKFLTIHVLFSLEYIGCIILKILYICIKTEEVFFFKNKKKNNKKNVQGKFIEI